MSPKKPRPPRYEPAPEVPPEMAERYAVIHEVLAGGLTVSAGAKRLGLSRNHFQTLLHRAEKAMLEAVTPKPAGRPAMPVREVELELEVSRLREENEQLKHRGESVERLLELAGDWARGKYGSRAPRARRPKKERTPSNDPEEPDGGRAREAWKEACRHVSLGYTWTAAALVVGASLATLRRWRRRAEANALLKQRPGPGAGAPPSRALQQQAADLVRELDGQVGAASLGKSVGLSRREAAKVKRETLRQMEVERKAGACRVTVSAPDVMRGFDPVFAQAREGRRFLMPVADAAIPKRTMVEVQERYDADSVCEVLKRDIETNGAPLVYRLDRAKQHDHPKVARLLAEHRILRLHGPAHYPQYYGQLERQNREHRAMLEAMGPVDTATMSERCRSKIAAMDTRWRRRSLGWRTAQEIWQNRPALVEDRDELRRDVERIAAKLKRSEDEGGRGLSADLAERLAIEAALTKRGYLSRKGGRC